MPLHKTTDTPLPFIADFTAELKGATIFSKVDLRKAYHQFPMHRDHVGKTALITPFGLFEFLRMPFGLKNSAQAFQRLMDSIFGEIPYVFAYINDVLVASRSPEEHAVHLRKVFGLLKANGLSVNVAKCELGVRELDFLGHHVSEAGITPMKARVETILNFPTPTVKKDVQRFVGMIQFYGRFIRGIGAILKPLHECIATKGKTVKDIVWSDACAAAFRSAKEALASVSLLHHPSPRAETHLTVDASDVAIGAKLEQREGKSAACLFLSKIIEGRTKLQCLRS